MMLLARYKTTSHHIHRAVSLQKIRNLSLLLCLLLPVSVRLLSNNWGLSWWVSSAQIIRSVCLSPVADNNPCPCFLTFSPPLTPCLPEWFYCLVCIHSVLTWCPHETRHVTQSRFAIRCRASPFDLCVLTRERNYASCIFPFWMSS